METVGFFHSEDPSTRTVVEWEGLNSRGRKRKKKMEKIDIVMKLLCLWRKIEERRLS